jgi:hypothetical protein
MRSLRNAWVLGGLLLVVLTATTPARAGLLVDIASGGSPLVCGVGCGENGTTFGWAFSLSTPVLVDGIGWFDSGADGLGTSVQAGLWTDSGTLLASATITSSSTVVASASANGDWLFESIAPILLAPGNYLVGGVFFATLPVHQFPVTPITIPGVTVTGGAKNDENSGFGAPLSSFEPIFGPTLSAAVPGPGVLALLGAGLVVIGLRRRATRRP